MDSIGVRALLGINKNWVDQRAHEIIIQHTALHVAILLHSNSTKSSSAYIFKGAGAYEGGNYNFCKSCIWL